MFIEVGKKDKLWWKKRGHFFQLITTFIVMLNNLIDSRQIDLARNLNEKIYSVRFKGLA